MATAGITPGRFDQSSSETAGRAWLERFTQSERDQLLHDDEIAGRSISIILVSIFIIGLLLSVVAVLMS